MHALSWILIVDIVLLLAPSMKIYCMYGVGLPTERSYYYARSSQEQGSVCEENDTTCHEVGDDAYDKARDLAESLSSTAMDILQPPELVMFLWRYCKDAFDSLYSYSILILLHMIQIMVWKLVYDSLMGK